MELKNNILLILLIVLGSVFIGYKFGSKRVVTKYERTETSDTTSQWNKPLKAEKIIPHHLLIPVENIPDVFLGDVFIDSTKVIDVTFVDTLLVDVENEDSLVLKIWHYGQPIDLFNIEAKWNRKIITNTFTEKITLDKPTSIFDNVGLGVGVGFDLQGKPNVMIGVFYRVDLFSLF